MKNKNDNAGMYVLKLVSMTGSTLTYRFHTERDARFYLSLLDLSLIQFFSVTRVTAQG